MIILSKKIFKYIMLVSSMVTVLGLAFVIGILSHSFQHQLMNELKKDYTIVMVTHNMQQATRISDKTAFFLLGEVVEFADTDKLFSMPADKRTEDYITGRFG